MDAIQAGLESFVPTPLLKHPKAARSSKQSRRIRQQCLVNSFNLAFRCNVVTACRDVAMLKFGSASAKMKFPHVGANRA